MIPERGLFNPNDTTNVTLDEGHYAALRHSLRLVLHLLDEREPGGAPSERVARLRDHLRTETVHVSIDWAADLKAMREFLAKNRPHHRLRHDRDELSGGEG